MRIYIYIYTYTYYFSIYIYIYIYTYTCSPYCHDIPFSNPAKLITLTAAPLVLTPKLFKLSQLFAIVHYCSKPT